MEKIKQQALSPLCSILFLTKFKEFEQAITRHQQGLMRQRGLKSFNRGEMNIVLSHARTLKLETKQLSCEVEK